MLAATKLRKTEKGADVEGSITGKCETGGSGSSPRGGNEKQGMAGVLEAITGGVKLKKIARAEGIYGF